jgi:hypothetical protein
VRFATTGVPVTDFGALGSVLVVPPAVRSRSSFQPDGELGPHVGAEPAVVARDPGNAARPARPTPRRDATGRSTCPSAVTPGGTGGFHVLLNKVSSPHSYVLAAPAPATRGALGSPRRRGDTGPFVIRPRAPTLGREGPRAPARTDRQLLPPDVPEEVVLRQRAVRGHPVDGAEARQVGAPPAVERSSATLVSAAWADAPGRQHDDGRDRSEQRGKSGAPAHAAASCGAGPALASAHLLDGQRTRPGRQQRPYWPARRDASCRHARSATASGRSRQSVGRRTWYSGGLSCPEAAKAVCAVVRNFAASAARVSSDPADSRTAAC